MVSHPQSHRVRAFHVGVAGPQGSGKTTLIERLARHLYPILDVAVVATGAAAQRGAAYVLEQGALPASRIRGTAADDPAAAAEAIAELERTLPGLKLVFVERGGAAGTAAHHPELADAWLYVTAAAPAAVPGTMAAGLLVVTKTDLAPTAHLTALGQAWRRRRAGQPLAFTDLTTDAGLADVIAWLEAERHRPRPDAEDRGGGGASDDGPHAQPAGTGPVPR